MPHIYFTWNKRHVELTNVLHFIVANGCPDLTGGLVNGKITFDKSPVNGQYPVGTIASFSCNSGYVLDAFSFAFCFKADPKNPNPYWFQPLPLLVFRVAKCEGNKINRLLLRTNKIPLLIYQIIWSISI